MNSRNIVRSLIGSKRESFNEKIKSFGSIAL